MKDRKDDKYNGNIRNDRNKSVIKENVKNDHVQENKNNSTEKSSSAASGKEAAEKVTQEEVSEEATGDLTNKIESKGVTVSTNETMLDITDGGNSTRHLGFKQFRIDVLFFHEVSQKAPSYIPQFNSP